MAQKSKIALSTNSSDGSRFRTALYSTVALSAWAVASTPMALAQAQQSVNSNDTAQAAKDVVVVTGSRIRGVDAVGSNVIAFDHEEIVEAGAPSTGDLLRQVPQIIGLGASETASGAQNGAANATRSLSVNLRGIGSNATLLLLNGRRIPPAGTQGQLSDASVIPSLAIQGLEVVADGGSAIYGSDAVTGVVNIIPRARFTGQETAIRYGAADGYADWSIAHIAGFDWKSGHVMATVDYSHHDALVGSDRDFYTSDQRSRGGSDFRSNQCAPGNILVGGVSYAIPAGGVTPATANTLTPNTQNLCDNTPRGDIIPELDRTSFLINAEQDLTSSTTVFAEGFYSKREFVQNDSQVTSNLTVPNTNAFYANPTGGTGPVIVQYDFANDGGLPSNPGFATSWQAAVGLRQDLGADWQVELYASTGESEDQVSRTQNINNATLGGFLASSDPAVAFNPFGAGGTNNASTVAAVRDGRFVIQGATSLDVYSIKADGPVFDLPAGQVRLAVGGEYREEVLTGELGVGSVAAPAVIPSATSRDVQAIFAEAFIPILDASSSAGSLDLSLAGRFEEYSDFGDTFNPKVGLVWTPSDQISLHASWGTSFRAPGLAENDPQSGGYGLYGDTLPCDHRPPATTCSGIGIAGGNPDLDPEEATTWSIGGEFTPAALTGLRVSATYFDIEYENQILGLRGTAGLLTNPAYAPYRTLNPSAAEINALLNSGLPINRPINPATVTYIQDGRRQNLSATLASGIDFDVSHTWMTASGDFSLGFAGTYFTNLETSFAPGAAPVDIVNTINNPQRFRARTFAGWRKGAVNLRGTLNYTNPYDQTSVTPVMEIDAYTTLDLHLGYDLGEVSTSAALDGLSINLDIRNAFDEEPPFVNQSGGFDGQSADPIGRVAAISVRKAW